MSNLDPGKYDTEDEFTALLSFPTGFARVHLSWTAGVRKVIYTIQGEEGAIMMEDDHLKIETKNSHHGSNGSYTPMNRVIERRSISSAWSDSSHGSWFNCLFDEFREAIDHGDFAGKDACEAALCVQLINTAYRSAREESRELPLSGLG